MLTMLYILYYSLQSILGHFPLVTHAVCHCLLVQLSHQAANSIPADNSTTDCFHRENEDEKKTPERCSQMNTKQLKSLASFL